jgi:hypothetical protein
MTQLYALPGQSVASPWYFAMATSSIVEGTTTLPPADRIYAAFNNPPTRQGWIDVETGNALGFFPHGTVLQVRASGGFQNAVLWVVAVDAQGYRQVYKGNWVNGAVTQWNLASGTGNQAIGDAADLFVNPYNSNYAFVADAQASTIKWTSDGGAHWNALPVLTNIATNNGQFRFGGYDTFFDNTCALSGMSFSRVNPNIAVAALYPGGVAYTQNYGQTWAALPGVTSGPTPAPANNLPGYPMSVWYDDNAQNGIPAIYVSMHWNRTVRVDGNFGLLPAN